MTNPITLGRGRSRARRTLLALTTTILCSGLAAPALAQSPYKNLDGNGVDLTDGTFNPSLPIYAIGSGQAELALVATPIQANTALDNWSNIWLYQSVSGGVTTVSVSLGATFDSFTSADGFATSRRGTGATVTLRGSSAVYRTLDGVTIAFANPNPAVFGGGSSNFCNDTTTANCSLLPTTVEGKAGMAVNYDWDVTLNCVFAQAPDTDNACNEYWRLRGVSNDAGYGIAWTYVNETGSPVPAYFKQATATFSNANVSGASPVVTYAYPSSGVTTLTTPGGKTWRITAPAGAITGIRRPGATSDTITISYSGGNVSSVTNDGVTTNYSRSVSGSTATMIVTDALSNATSIVSDMGKFRPTSVTDPLGRVTTMTYDSVGKLTEIAYPEGDRKQFGYDAASRTTSVTLKAKPGSGLADIVTSTSFGSGCVDATCPAWSTDALGNQTDYTYDGATGLVATVTLPAATGGATRGQTRYSYATVAGVAMVTGVSTCRTGAAPACLGTADETRQTASYDANLNMIAATVAAGDASLTASTALSYDAAGNLVAADGPYAGAADTTTYVWGADREPVATIAADPDGAGALPRQAVKTSYDAAGRPAVVENGTAPGASLSGFVSLQQATAGYDGNGRKVTDTVTAGGYIYALTQYSHDALGRVECSALRMNHLAWGSLPASACSLGTTGSFGPDRIARTVYDAAGQALKRQSAYATADQADEATAAYNLNGTLAILTDAEGHVTHYSYDGFDRLTEVHYADPATGAASPSDYNGYLYDANGNLTAERKRAGHILYYGYDALNRLAVKDLPGGTASDVYYGYDLTGALTFARFQSTSGAGVSASYDALGRQTGTTSTMGGVSRTLASQYDAAGNRSRLDHPDGVYFTQGHDGLGRQVTASWWTPGSGTVPFTTLGYTDQGRRTVTVRGSSSTTYGYDPAGRTTGLSQNFAGGVGDATTTLAYNPAWQIMTATRSNDDYAWPGAANADDASAINHLNQPVTVGAATLTHDANGNVTSDGTGTYSYDPENRLIAGGPANAALSYDPLGRLWQISSAAYGNTQFLYDGDQVAVEYNGATGAIRRRYYWGPGTDEPIMQDEGPMITCGGTRFLPTDERGSIVAAADCWGTRTNVNAYDEYGHPASTNWGRYQYTGQAWLPELGLYYYKARMYAPGLGFMQTDPIGYADGVNWYAYAGGDPVNNTDPSGLATCASKGKVYTNKGRADVSDARLEAACNAVGGTFSATVIVTAQRNSGNGAALLGGGRDRGGSSVGGEGSSGGEPQKAEVKPAPPVDYCGSKGSAGVPDGVWGGACKKHDICYGTPGNSKGGCDFKLGVDIIGECSRRSYGVGAAWCVNVGLIYSSGLLLLGVTPWYHPSRDAYNAAQKPRFPGR